MSILTSLLPLILVVIFLIIVFTILGDERKKFKSIDFKSKKKYLIVQFLHGNCGLKTNKAVLSRDGDVFLIETEDNSGKVESFTFNRDQVVDITIKEQLGSKMVESLHNGHASSDNLMHDTNIHGTATMKLKKQYDINIILQNDIRLHLLSTKAPYNIFD